jgi:predicted  nucleic acid-binding Zn-ribbon protein
MNLIAKMLTKTSTPPATLADCRQIAEQLRAKRSATPTNGTRASGVHQFHIDATRLLDLQGAMERRAALGLQDLPSYRADRDTEAHALAAEISSTKTQLDHIAQTFQRLKDERAQPLARLEAAAATSAATIDELSAAHAKAKQSKADAQAAHIADGAAGTLDTRKLDTEVRRSADALEEARERLAAVNGRLQAIGAEIAQAEADANERAKALNDHIKSLEQSAQELTIDTAAGLYVLTLAHALRDPYELPKFDLKIHDARRVPFVSGRTYEVTDGNIAVFLRAQAAPSPDEWLSEVRASGVLDFQYEPVHVPHMASEKSGGWFQSVSGR